MSDSIALVKKQSKRHPLKLQHSSFFQAILEGLIDGILILSHEGELVHANTQASCLCQQFSSKPSHPSRIPQEVWRVCQSLIEGRQLFPGQPMMIDSEVRTPGCKPLRLRGRWLNLAESVYPYLLITIEDCQQSLKNQVIAESKKYGFTSREAEIWLLRRTKHSYKDIAAKLYISENTVKKHMKNIHAKRKKVHWAEQC